MVYMSTVFFFFCLFFNFFSFFNDQVFCLSVSLVVFMYYM